jgi:hypothetical protein
MPGETATNGGCSGLLSGDDLVAAQTVTRANEHDRVIGECAMVTNPATLARRFRAALVDERHALS